MLLLLFFSFFFPLLLLLLSLLSVLLRSKLELTGPPARTHRRLARAASVYHSEFKSSFSASLPKPASSSADFSAVARSPYP